MALSVAELGQSMGGVVSLSASILWIVVQVIVVLGVIGYIWVYFSFNVKIMARELTKHNRTTVKILRAKKIIDKKLKQPKLQLFGMLGFGGLKIPVPPAECIYPYKSSMGNTTLYDFVVKDGQYYPVSNQVLGHKVGEDKEGKEIYSLDGSGLETTRNFDAEEASLNNLMNAADKYRNKPPIEIAAMYGLMIIVIVGSFIVIVYSIYKAGQIQDAITQGWDKFGQFSEVISQQKLGPN